MTAIEILRDRAALAREQGRVKDARVIEAVARAMVGDENAMTDTYWRKLRRHPGVQIASAMMLFGAIAAAPDRWICGALLSAIWWLPVLWTARTQP